LKSHDGVEIAIHRDFIRRGVFSKTFAETFKTLRKSRQVCDYGILDDIPESEARA